MPRANLRRPVVRHSVDHDARGASPGAGEVVPISSAILPTSGTATCCSRLHWPVANVLYSAFGC